MDIRHDISPRIEDLEGNVEEMKDELDERVSQLEYETHRSS